jgi:hypothetical protein
METHIQAAAFLGGDWEIEGNATLPIAGKE